MDRITLKAPAKINLYLEVGSRRPDGYHSVRTVLQAVEWFDLVELEMERVGRGVELEVAGEAPAGEENLCQRAVGAFLEATGVSMGVKVKLTKRIPLAAGLGGGSSDAAAVLRGLNHLTGGSLGREELFRLASSLGSDVPFFLVGGTALGEGRGERIIPVVQAPPLPVVLVNPGSGLPTAEVYRRFDSSPRKEPPAEGLRSLLDSLAAGDVRRLASFLHNSLQEAACELLPVLREILDAARRAGAGGVLVSGSGPTVFMLAADDREAELLASRMEEIAPVVFRTRFCRHGVAPVE